MNEVFFNDLCDSEYYNAFFLKSPIGLAIVDPSGAFIEVNEAAAMLLEYARSELKHMTFQQITHQEDMRGDQMMVNMAVEGKIDKYEMVKRYICKTGRMRWCRLHVRAIRDKNGKLRHFVSMITPIDTQEIITDSRNRSGRLLQVAVGISILNLFLTLGLGTLHILGKI